MNKKAYQTPYIVVITIAAHQLICESTISTTVIEEGQTPPGGWGPSQAPRRRSTGSVWDN
jgi:hypothetical protein